MCQSADKDGRHYGVGQQSLLLTDLFEATLGPLSGERARVCVHSSRLVATSKCNTAPGGLSGPSQRCCLSPADTQEVGLWPSEATGHSVAPVVCIVVFFALRVCTAVLFLCVLWIMMKINNSKVEALRYFALDWNDSWNSEKWMRCSYFETYLQLISCLKFERPN